MHRLDGLYGDDLMRYLLSMSGDFLWIKLGVFCIGIHESMYTESD